MCIRDRSDHPFNFCGAIVTPIRLEIAFPTGEIVTLGRKELGILSYPVSYTHLRKKRPDHPSESDLAALESTDWEAVKAEVDALRQRMGSMGAVNLVAIEEYSELKQRHDFLRTQSDDLARAKADLMAAIDEINQTSQRQFQVTFEQIRKNFEYTFQTLFGGGKASIELVQAEDVLESGIEIVAQPPGTRMKGITLLSGGQRTLTAVALLFALYLRCV